MGLPEMSSPMYMARVGCVACHYQKESGGARKYTGTTFFPSKEACVKCHGSEFKGIWEETGKALKGAQRKFTDKLEKARSAVSSAGLKGEPEKKIRAKLAKVESRYEFLIASRGEHNIYLASEILRRGNTSLNEIGTDLGASLPDISDDPLISGMYCATMCHPKVGVKVPPETVRYKGKTMPHKAHTEFGGGCVKCHDIGAHKQTPLKKDAKAFCVNCHEGGP